MECCENILEISDIGVLVFRVVVVKVGDDTKPFVLVLVIERGQPFDEALGVAGFRIDVHQHSVAVLAELLLKVDCGAVKSDCLECLWCRKV